MIVNFPVSTTTPNIRPLSKSGFGMTQPVPAPAESKLNAEEIKTDSSEIKQEPAKKEEHKGIVRSLKDFIRSVKKFGISFSEYTKGTLAGLFGGAALGGTVFGVGHIVNLFKKRGAKEVDATKYSVQNILQLDKETINEGTPLEKAHHAAKKIVGKDIEKVISNEVDPEKLKKYNNVFTKKIEKAAIKELSDEDKKLFSYIEKITPKLKLVPAKTLGALVGVAVLLRSLWKASLNANERKADVDHRYTTTPIISK